VREHISYASGMKQARENALEGNEYGNGFEPFQSGQAAALTKLRHSLICACVCVCECMCMRGKFLETRPPCIWCNVCNMYVCHAESLIMYVLYKA
jgi:hypothetical protein